MARRRFRPPYVTSSGACVMASRAEVIVASKANHPGMTGNGRLPWFPLYVDRFLGSRKIKRMSAERVGIYFLLLIAEWDEGPLPSNPEDLDYICNGADLSEIRAVLRLCFRRTPDGWVNDVLEEIRISQTKRHNRRVEAGRKGGKAKQENKEATSA